MPPSLACSGSQMAGFSPCFRFRQLTEKSRLSSDHLPATSPARTSQSSVDVARSHRSRVGVRGRSFSENCALAAGCHPQGSVRWGTPPQFPPTYLSPATDTPQHATTRWGLSSLDRYIATRLISGACSPKPGSPRLGAACSNRLASSDVCPQPGPPRPGAIASYTT